MTASASSWQRSSDLLRSLLLCFGLVATLLLSAGLSGLDLVGRKREQIAAAEQSRGLLAAALATNLRGDQLQDLIVSYVASARKQSGDGINFLLVVNRAGQIIYSSRPSWRQLMITDPIIDQAETDDANFRWIVHCFRHRDDTCVEFESGSLNWDLNRSTVVRTVHKPSADLGLPRDRFLVVVNYDDGVLASDFLFSVVLNLLISLLICATLTLLLWLLLAGQMLPRFAKIAQTDSLTQLMNRGIFMDLSKHILAEAEQSQADLVFAILDIDFFKQVNDTFGHACGDAALQHVAQVFRAVIRSEDLLCRFGGEEFAMLLNLPRQAGARCLERLRLQLQMSSLNYRGHRLSIKASIGAVATRDYGYNLDYLYSAADQALYTAKRAGRNRIVWSEGHVHGHVFSRLSI